MQIAHTKRLYIAVLVSAIIVAACQSPEKHPDTDSTAHPQHIATTGIDLHAQLAPANSTVLAQLKTTTLRRQEIQDVLTVPGFIGYDTRNIGTIAARVMGRIEKLYVTRRYQLVKKGQPVMEIYSPALLTAQEQLLLMIRQDPDNQTLITAAKQKLLLLGMSPAQLEQLINTGKPKYTITVFSAYTGHIHETGNSSGMSAPAANAMPSPVLQTAALNVKEGMYVEQGQVIFSVFNADRAWAELYLFPEQQARVRLHDRLRITPLSAPQQNFRAQIDYIAPFYKEGSRQLTARAYFDNSARKLPIGSEVSVALFSEGQQADFLPQSAVISLGLEKIVFVKTGKSFKTRKVITGITSDNLLQIKAGINTSDTIALNAQYLVDSESFVKVNE